ncbi:hypothetical protein AAU57_11670 [Nonlabens sp. YIK11]|uniref:GLPGLI family protein n=1 Tax=Nonlabens sp. YIK11 TaxID=1453349 RepID=UPI0006DBE83F|nr:GLPGLI family protein [Nonlabens sp. YIK11]KQC33915.1 hypothetical protein AAU57_11670 [Nonlabens sp. YIK11]
MLRLFSLILIFNYSLLFSQVEQEVTSIAYLHSYKLTDASESYRQVNMNLQIFGNESSFQSYNQRVLDTLIRDKQAVDADISRLTTDLKYHIYINGKSAVFTDRFTSAEYQYVEKLDYEWELLDGQKIIKGFKCYKARIFYDGREWVAWYTPEIPLNAGPYKFKGLPGLIMRVADKDELFIYEYAASKMRNKTDLKKFFYVYGFDNLVKVEKDLYLKTRKLYKNLSSDEQLNFNRKGGKLIRIGEENRMRRKFIEKPNHIFPEIDKVK